jgi:tetratricopeptide (TPR) repeat protein
MRGKLLSLLIIIFLLVGLLNGCKPLRSSRDSGVVGKDEITKTPADIEKQKLLRQLDKKFENPDAHYQLGKLYQADGLWTQAEYRFKMALSFDPAHRPAQAARVKVLQATGDDERTAILLADEYMQQASVSAEQSLLLALAFQKEALDDYAVACYQQALKLAPNSAKIHRQIGYYYLSKNNTTQAIDYLTRSFQLNPNQPEVAGELGRLGIAVQIPRSAQTDTKRLDKMVDKSTPK